MRGQYSSSSDDMNTQKTAHNKAAIDIVQLSVEFYNIFSEICDSFSFKYFRRMSTLISNGSQGDKVAKRYRKHLTFTLRVPYACAQTSFRNFRCSFLFRITPQFFFSLYFNLEQCVSEYFALHFWIAKLSPSDFFSLRWLSDAALSKRSKNKNNECKWMCVSSMRLLFGAQQ